jgi:DnaJ family protein A protein 2
MPQDLYEVMRIPRSATADEIKRAYRKESLQRHPDRGGATEDFQELQRANEVLSDPEKRAHYDATGQIPGADAGPPPGAGGLEEMLGSIFGGGGGMGGMGGGFPFFGMGGMGGMGGGPRPAGKAPRGPNKVHEIGVSMSDLFHGKTIQINMKRDSLCSACSGKGGSQMEACGDCGGRGVRVRIQQMGPMTAMAHEPCGSCQQSGMKAKEKCGTCRGRCVVERETVLEAKVEPGMQEGDRLVFPGQCSESPLFEVPGDVILVVRAATSDDPRWVRAGADLNMEVVLTQVEALLGWERLLEGHPCGEPVRVVWRGGVVQHGARLVVEGSGMPSRDGKRGSLVLHCRIVQEALSEEQQRILKSVWPTWSEPVVGPGVVEAVRPSA